MAKRRNPNSDEGHDLVDDELTDLEMRISEVYQEAAADMQDTVTEYFDSFADRDAQQKIRLEKGEITEAQYKSWRLNQIGRGERFEAMRDKLAERYTNANEVAVSYINDATPGIYSLARNYTEYTIEKTGADVSFTLWDEQTVKRLIVENPDLMPYYPEEKAVKRGIDLAYGKQQITESVTSGILQGKGVGKIANDLQQRVSDMNRTSALRSARTAVTAAENAGRQDSYEEATKMGIEMEKVWVATLDDRTREAHQEADGQTVPQDQPFVVDGEELMYPGDDSMGASGANIYNCRCTMIAQVKGANMANAVRWARDPVTGEKEKVSNMTYKEWLASKNGA